MKIRLSYYNCCWNVYIYSTSNNYKDWIENIYCTTIVTREDNEGEYRLRKYRHPEIPCLHSFGLWYYDEQRRPGANGGEWSSNSESINKVFNTELIEVALDQIAVAVSYTWLKELLGDRVKWTIDEYDHPIINEVVGVNKDTTKQIVL